LFNTYESVEGEAEAIDKEVFNLMEEAQNTATRVLAENKQRLIHLAEKLTIEENLEGDKLEAVFTEPL
jgi:ATP-dependent Zn protease